MLQKMTMWMKNLKLMFMDKDNIIVSIIVFPSNQMTKTKYCFCSYYDVSAIQDTQVVEPSRQWQPI